MALTPASASATTASARSVDLVVTQTISGRSLATISLRSV